MLYSYAGTFCTIHNSSFVLFHFADFFSSSSSSSASSALPKQPCAVNNRMERSKTCIIILAKQKKKIMSTYEWFGGIYSYMTSVNDHCEYSTQTQAYIDFWTVSVAENYVYIAGRARRFSLSSIKGREFW